MNTCTNISAPVGPATSIAQAMRRIGSAQVCVFCLSLRRVWEHESKADLARTG